MMPLTRLSFSRGLPSLTRALMPCNNSRSLLLARLPALSLASGSAWSTALWTWWMAVSQSRKARAEWWWKELTPSTRKYCECRRLSLCVCVCFCVSLPAQKLSLNYYRLPHDG
jgi:hypothetical protein